MKFGGRYQLKLAFVGITSGPIWLLSVPIPLLVRGKNTKIRGILS